MSEAYGDVGRFRLAANALPLPIHDMTPADPLIRVNPPAFGFTVAKELKSLSRLACYASSQGQARLERLGKRRIEIRMAGPFPRVVCASIAPCQRPKDAGAGWGFSSTYQNPDRGRFAPMFQASGKKGLVETLSPRRALSSCVSLLERIIVLIDRT